MPLPCIHLSVCPLQRANLCTSSEIHSVPPTPTLKKSEPQSHLSGLGLRLSVCMCSSVDGLAHSGEDPSVRTLHFLNSRMQMPTTSVQFQVGGWPFRFAEVKSHDCLSSTL